MLNPTIVKAALLYASVTSDIVSVFRYRVVAFDMRGHGETTSSDDLDLSSNTLAAVNASTCACTDSMPPSLSWSVKLHTYRSSLETMGLKSEQVWNLLNAC